MVFVVDSFFAAFWWVVVVRSVPQLFRQIEQLFSASRQQLSTESGAAWISERKTEQIYQHVTTDKDKTS